MKCGALKLDPIGFKRPDGQPCVEAQYVWPVSTRRRGSLSGAKVVTVCANHHRQIHYGGVGVEIDEAHFRFNFPDVGEVVLARVRL